MYMRTMSEERLTALALMQCYPEKTPCPDIDLLVDKFTLRNPCKMALISVLSEA